SISECWPMPTGIPGIVVRMRSSAATADAGSSRANVRIETAVPEHGARHEPGESIDIRATGVTDRAELRAQRLVELGVRARRASDQDVRGKARVDVADHRG